MTDIRAVFERLAKACAREAEFGPLERNLSWSTLAIMFHKVAVDEQAASPSEAAPKPQADGCVHTDPPMCNACYNAGIERGRAEGRAELDRAVAIISALLKHSCIADSAPEDKDAEDHDVERMARNFIRQRTNQDAAERAREDGK